MFYRVVDCLKGMLDTIGKPTDSKIKKEAHMKRIFRINYVFWKEVSLLFDWAHTVPVFLRESELPRLRTLQSHST